MSGQQQQTLDQEKKKQLKRETADYLLKLNKCLRVCKRKVDSLSPKVIRPNVSQLRSAVDAAIFGADICQSTSVSSTATLHRLIQRAVTVSNLIYIADNVRSNSAYCCLVRIRSILNLTLRVSAVLNAYARQLAGQNVRVVEKDKTNYW